MFDFFFLMWEICNHKLWKLFVFLNFDNETFLNSVLDTELSFYYILSWCNRWQISVFETCAKVELLSFFIVGFSPRLLLGQPPNSTSRVCVRRRQTVMVRAHQIRCVRLPAGVPSDAGASFAGTIEKGEGLRLLDDGGCCSHFTATEDEGFRRVVPANAKLGTVELL